MTAWKSCVSQIRGDSRHRYHPCRPHSCYSLRVAEKTTVICLGARGSVIYGLAESCNSAICRDLRLVLPSMPFGISVARSLASVILNPSLLKSASPVNRCRLGMHDMFLGLKRRAQHVYNVLSLCFNCVSAFSSVLKKLHLPSLALLHNHLSICRPKGP
jgi:hypothetical protein